jgi:hypothetical protein
LYSNYLYIYYIKVKKLDVGITITQSTLHSKGYLFIFVGALFYQEKKEEEERRRRRRRRKKRRKKKEKKEELKEN